MFTVDKETNASGRVYPITFQQFDNLAEALEEIGSEENVLGVINAAQEQGAKQGGKEEVRKAISEHGTDSPEATAAVEDHQTRAAKYKIGAPRGGGPGGMTKTSAGNVGKALLEALGAEQLKALAAEAGVDPTLLG